MTENRRSSGSSRGRRTARPKTQQPQEGFKDTAERFEDSDERDFDPPREEESQECRSRPPEAEMEDEPFEEQPASLGRGSDIESQPSDDYAIETHFDHSIGQFTGGILEFPELRAQGPNREVVMADLEAQLGQRLEAIRHSGEDLPEPICERQYPESLQINLSQSLFRRLDRISRYEKLELNKLVCELLARAIERRDISRSQDRRPPQQSSGNQQGGHRHSNHRHQNRRGGSHRGRGYHESMQNKENFMEYVRNLENRGSGNWRKK